MSRQSAGMVAGGALSFAIAFGLGRVSAPDPGPAGATAQEACEAVIVSRGIEAERVTIAFGRLRAVQAETLRLEGAAHAWPDEVSSYSDPAVVRALVDDAVASSEIRSWLIDEDCTEFPCLFVAECVRPEGAHGAGGDCLNHILAGVEEGGSTASGFLGGSGAVDFTVFAVYDPANPPADEGHRRMWMRMNNMLLMHTSPVQGR